MEQINLGPTACGVIVRSILDNAQEEAGLLFPGDE